MTSMFQTATYKTVMLQMFWPHFRIKFLPENSYDVTSSSSGKTFARFIMTKFSVLFNFKKNLYMKNAYTVLFKYFFKTINTLNSI